MNTKNMFSALLVSMLSNLFIFSVANAQTGPLTTGQANITTTIGNITSIETGVNWVLNLFAYFGWAGVIIGVGLAIFSLIYKLVQSDSDEAMKAVQGYLTKAVLIVVAGILLIGASFIVRTVRTLFGQTSPYTFGGVASTNN